MEPHTPDRPERPLRKRMRRREVRGGVRFVTFSCQHRLPLLSHPRIAELFVLAMAAARREFAFELFAWVVMPEHVHMLVRLRDWPLDRVLVAIKKSVAQRVINRWRELGEAGASMLVRITAEGAPRFWQKGGGFDRNVRDDTELSKEVKYIHWNPVERGLVLRPEDWKWSSVRWWMGEREGEVECDPPPGNLRNWKGFM